MRSTVKRADTAASFIDVNDPGFNVDQIASLGTWNANQAKELDGGTGSAAHEGIRYACFQAVWPGHRSEDEHEWKAEPSQPT